MTISSLGAFSQTNSSGPVAVIYDKNVTLERIARIAFSVLFPTTLVISCFCVVATISTSFPLAVGVKSFICAAIFSVLTYIAKAKCKDYSSYKSIDSYRKESTQLSLDQIIDKHGVKNVLEKGLIYPSRLLALLKDKILDKPFIDSLTFLRAWIRDISHFSPSRDFLILSLRSPSWIDWESRWNDFRRNTSATELVIDLDLDLLGSCPGFNGDELALLTDIKNSLSQHLRQQQDSIELLRTVYQQNVRQYEQELVDTFGHLLESFKSSLESNSIEIIDQEHDLRLNTLKIQKESEIKICRDLISQVSKKLLKISLLDNNYQKLSSIKENLLKKIIKIELKYSALFSQEREELLRLRQTHAEVIKNADFSRIAGQNSAIEIFNQNIDRVTRDRDLSLALIRQRFLREKEILDQSYIRFLER